VVAASQRFRAEELGAIARHGGRRADKPAAGRQVPGDDRDHDAGPWQHQDDRRDEGAKVVRHSKENMRHCQRWNAGDLMTSPDIRAALERHWAASDASDFETEHEIYRDDAILDYPQSGERIRGRRHIQLSRTAQPNKKRFSINRMFGKDDLWITEFVLTYDGQPSYVVSIMEFEGGQVAHETQYFGDAFAPGPSRAQWVEPIR
jgi:SnoaL-like domain